MRDWDLKEWLIVAAFVLAALVLFLVVVKSAEATPTVDVVGCRQTNYPAVCAASYHKCDTIGLDAACLAVAQLDGQVGHDYISGRKIPTSQNTVTGDKPVESVHK